MRVQNDSVPITLKRKKWEHREFIFDQWTLDRQWTILATDEVYILPLALDFFWQVYQQLILDELLKWQGDGWQPIKEPDAQALKLSWSQSTSTGIDPSDVIMWIATFGIALVLQIISGELPRRYVTFTPVEYRLMMRRPLLIIDPGRP
jgi:hypothetical protein